MIRLEATIPSQRYDLSLYNPFISYYVTNQILVVFFLLETKSKIKNNYRVSNQ
jgi:hypothetical protein